MQLNRPLISVIVPVYNVVRFLDRCVESIVSQTYSKIEILLVDDGSTDGSSLKCDFWAGKDDRISVIHKRNGGLSDARNAGLDVCLGEYIAFVDSDDYVDSRFIERMFDALSRCSSTVSVCDVVREDESGNVLQKSRERRPQECVMSGRKCLGLTYVDPNAVTAWSKLYHRSLWEGLRFPKGRLHEDEFVFHEIMYQCDRVVVIADELYHYVQHRGSIMHTWYDIRYLDRIDAWLQRLDAFVKHGEGEDLIIPLLHMIMNDLYSSARLDWRDTRNEHAVVLRINRLFDSVSAVRDIVPDGIWNRLVEMRTHPRLAVKTIYWSRCVSEKIRVVLEGCRRMLVSLSLRN
ncbi:glycosyltransferase [Bifidobacterium pseudocatenulatum]|jgi:glycosyltransferase involved in cell wall biosynthesis|nr:glycosyltransferase [Bifidobacterium pseudocatenulatum]